ncbi:HTH-type transcriptional regulator NsrR [Agaricicola taiwanensis]|uniref:HTH-type transcriptional regulator NsrR n=1 Tax=Agaricicola taiwanensis TaxID=591372 RepID=A0A8J3DXX1_9RHOB|nr:Rrf2 family transcriptional regulator [Agaricicola taiwanensis]GGE52349.1 HTH-type transcriptional regulator NsrR [Agaricicola taiwanensis]
MRLTLHTDYALRVMIYLSAHEERLCSIGEIAGAYGISHNHLMKVVHRLGKAGFVETTRGRSGGVRLAKPPAEIRVGDVIKEMEEGLELVDCGSCSIAAGCGMTKVLNEAVAAFMSVFDRYTFADLPAGGTALSLLWRR